MIAWKRRNNEINGTKEGLLVYWTFLHNGLIECVVWSENDKSKGKAVAVFKERKK